MKLDVDKATIEYIKKKGNIINVELYTTNSCCVAVAEPTVKFGKPELVQQFDEYIIDDITIYINKFIELLTSSGFQVLESGTYFIKPFSHKQMSELIESKIIDVKVLDGLYKMTGYMPDLGSEIYAEFKIHD